MPDLELDENINILRGDPIQIQVKRIKWQGPHEFITVWKTYKVLPADTDEEELRNMVMKLYSNRNYFRVCTNCQERKIVGSMNGDTCHSCMEDQGVVF